LNKNVHVMNRRYLSVIEYDRFLSSVTSHLSKSHTIIAPCNDLKKKQRNGR